MSGPRLRALSAATVIVLIGGYALAAFYAPMDADQGFIQKIFYLHVPMAIVALCGFVFAGLCAIGHLRTGDFFEAETYPTIDFVSTGVRVEGGDFKVDGDLTIRGITKPVTFDFDFGGFGGDPYGNYKGGATAKAVINREDFGLTYNAALETGGVLLGDQVTITLELQAALQQ